MEIVKESIIFTTSRVSIRIDGYNIFLSLFVVSASVPLILSAYPYSSNSPYFIPSKSAVMLKALSKDAKCRGKQSDDSHQRKCGCPRHSSGGEHVHGKVGTLAPGLGNATITWVEYLEGHTSLDSRLQRRGVSMANCDSYLVNFDPRSPPGCTACYRTCCCMMPSSFRNNMVIGQSPPASAVAHRATRDSAVPLESIRHDLREDHCAVVEREPINFETGSSMRLLRYSIVQQKGRRRDVPHFDDW